MIAIIARSLWARRRRLVATLIAVALGVAFLAGTLLLSDTLRANFDRLFTQADGGTSVVLEMYVDNVDQAFAHAVQLGAKPLLPPTDMFFGDRYSWVDDPWGHVWALATVKETLDEGEIQRRAEEFMAAMSNRR